MQHIPRLRSRTLLSCITLLVSDVQEVDLSTRYFIEQCLKEHHIDISQELLCQLSCNLTKKELYINHSIRSRDTVKHLREQLDKELEKHHDACDRSQMQGESMDGEGYENRRPSPQTEIETVQGAESCDNPSTSLQRANQNLKDDNQDLEEKVKSMENSKAKCLKDYNNLTEKCDRYLTMVTQLSEDLQQVKQEGNAAGADLHEKEQENSALHQQVESADLEIQQKTETLEKTTTKLELAEQKLAQSIDEENRLKDLINLPHTASDTDVTTKLQQLIEKGNQKYKLSEELRKVKRNNYSLKEEIVELRREKKTIEFDLRQVTCLYKRLICYSHPVIRPIRKEVDLHLPRIDKPKLPAKEVKTMPNVMQRLDK